MTKQNPTRNEKDSLGEIKVPKEAYYGAFTVRASENFQISSLTPKKSFIYALATVKLAAAKANTTLKIITKKQEKAIEQATKELLSGKFDDQTNLDVYQAGAGTSYNMNINEILANRANEILGGKKGHYEHVHPNNHVNQAQSTNDTIPTATRIATLSDLPALEEELKKLIATLQKLAIQEKDTLKVGRTHLQDAVPITLGQEFDAKAQALEKGLKHLQETKKALNIISLGGTAVGTGINTDPQYKKLVTKALSLLTGHKLQSAKNLTEGANNMNPFLDLSAALRSISTTLLNLSSDLKLMNMGPKAGLMEIELPAVQPGSSIMPGKVNPSILEALDMICFKVSGGDKTIELAAARSHFDLNVHCPIIMDVILHNIEILTNGMKMLRQKALTGLKINHAHIKKTFENSLCTGTALAPYLGYNQTADIIKSALKNNRTIKEEVLQRKLMTPKKLEEILSVKSTTQPKKHT